MKVPVVKIYQSAKGNMSHYVFRTQDATTPRTIEEYVNHHEPVGVVREISGLFSLKTLDNISLSINGYPSGYPDFTSFSLPYEFNIPNSNYKIEFKNNVTATDVVSYTIYLGLNVISKVEENINGVITVITDGTYINDNFKILPNAILINSTLSNYSLATFYGKIKTFGFQDDGTCTDLECVPSRAHGIYTPVLTTVEAADYISFYQNADSRKNLYYYNVISKTIFGEISEMSNGQVCEVTEDPIYMAYTLESSDDYYSTLTPTWNVVDTKTPVEEIRITKKELVSSIVPTDNFMVYANDDSLRLENLRELKITNIWNPTNRKLMNRDKKVFRAINKYIGSASVESDYSKVVEFGEQIEILVDKIVIVKKDVSALSDADKKLPVKLTDVDSQVIKVFVRQGGTYYKDFFLNEFGTNKNEEYYDYDDDYNKIEIPDYLVSAMTLDSRFPLLSIKDNCLYGNKYNYTIYLYDELGRISTPIVNVL